MSLEFAYTFNENDTASIVDYSTNAKVSNDTKDLTIGDGNIGKVGIFNGSSSYVEYANITDLGGTDSLAIFTKLTIESSQEHRILSKAGQYLLGINAGGKVVFTVVLASGTKTLTGSTIISLSTYTTIGAVYNGATMYIYIDGAEDVTQAETGNIVSSSNNEYLGTDTADYLDGKIEYIELRSDNLTADNITALHERPGGLLLDLADTSKYSLGDLLEITDGTTISKGVLTFDAGSGQLLYLPISGGIPHSLNLVRHRGNVLDTTRQYINQQQITGNSPEFLIQDLVKSFAPSGFVNNRVQINKNTIAQDNIDLLKLALIAN
jgi:hypothetical protein